MRRVQYTIMDLMKMRIESDHVWFMDQHTNRVEPPMTPAIQQPFGDMSERFLGSDPATLRGKLHTKLLRKNNPLLGPSTHVYGLVFGFFWALAGGNPAIADSVSGEWPGGESNVGNPRADAASMSGSSTGRSMVTRSGAVRAGLETRTVTGTGKADTGNTGGRRRRTGRPGAPTCSPDDHERLRNVRMCVRRPRFLVFSPW